MSYTLHEILPDYVRWARSYLEVGVCEGGTLSIALQHAEDLERLVLCDTWAKRYGGSNRGDHKHIDRLIEDSPYDGPVEFLNGDSEIRLEELLAQGEEQFDLVTIDGDHSLGPATRDLSRALRLVNRGGVVLFDDITHPSHGDLIYALEHVAIHLGETDIKLHFGGINGCAAIRRL